MSRKGHDMVIRALPLLCKSTSDFTYLIVGDGPYRDNLEALAADLGVHEQVVFAGHLTDEILPDVYALCDVFVMPSRDNSMLCDIEGFGLVFLEANACGKPVIGGRSGGIPDAVVDGVTGILVRPDDPEDIADALKRILNDNALALRLGRQGRDRVVNQFTWGKCARNVRKILRTVISEKKNTKKARNA